MRGEHFDEAVVVVAARGPGELVGLGMEAEHGVRLQHAARRVLEGEDAGAGAEVPRHHGADVRLAQHAHQAATRDHPAAHAVEHHSVHLGMVRQRAVQAGRRRIAQRAFIDHAAAVVLEVDGELTVRVRRGGDTDQGLERAVVDGEQGQQQQAQGEDGGARQQPLGRALALAAGTPEPERAAEVPQRDHQADGSQRHPPGTWIDVVADAVDDPVEDENQQQQRQDVAEHELPVIGVGRRGGRDHRRRCGHAGLGGDGFAQRHPGAAIRRLHLRLVGERATGVQQQQQRPRIGAERASLVPEAPVGVQSPLLMCSV